jgi:adenosylcobinamide-GDP ribazoletransferase
MEGIEALMKHVYVFPVVGLALGAIIAALAFLSYQALAPNLVAMIVIIAIYRLCGINHIDGLADFGDGVIAHGTTEKKIQAMKDVSLGTGGGVFITVLILATFAIVSDIAKDLLPLALIVSEVSAKEAMITFAAFSRSLQKGFGQIMIEKTGIKQFLISFSISAIICATILGSLGLAMLAISLAGAFYMVLVAKRNFGGATGDGIGATNEICRLMALAAALTLGGALPWTL